MDDQSAPDDTFKITRNNINHQPWKNVSPNVFVDSILQTLEEKILCSYEADIHVFSSHCNARLIGLSTVLSCLDQAEAAIEKLMTSGQEENDVDAASENKYSVIQNYSLGYTDTQGNPSTAKNNPDHNKDWFNKTCLLLIEKEIIFKLLTFLQKSQCEFASYLAGKIICLCAVRYDKVAGVLNHIQDKWRSNGKLAAHELVLILGLVSSTSRNYVDSKSVSEEVGLWFIEKVAAVKSSLIQQLLQDHGESFKEKFLILSILGKVLKYKVISSRKDMSNFVASIVTDILDHHKEIFFSTGQSKDDDVSHVIFRKFLKLLNNCTLHLPLHILGKIKPPSEAILHMNIKILNYFTCLFDMCASKGYLSSMTFWKRNDSRGSIRKNFVVMRDLFVLAVKASTVLRYNSCLYSLKVLNVCRVVESWLIEQFEYKELMSGWLSLLLGDQDDQWIYVMLCLLLIYKHLTQEMTDSTLVKGSHPPSSSLMIDPKHSHISSEISLNSICPFTLFLEFSKFICYDHLVISDFLMSPETYFLEYLILYLSHLKFTWDSFVSFCHHNDLNKNKDRLISVRLNRSPIKRKITFNQKKSDIEEKFFSQIKSVKNKRKMCNFASQKISKIEDNSFGLLVSYPISDSDSSDVETGGFHSSHDAKNSCNTFSSELGATEGENQIISHSHQDLSNLESFSSDSKLDSGDKDSSEKSINPKAQFLTPYQSELHIKNKENRSDKDSNSSCASSDNSQPDDILERLMTMFIRIRFHLERLNNHGLLPYKADVLLGLLLSIEEKYENYEII